MLEGVPGVGGEGWCVSKVNGIKGKRRPPRLGNNLRGVPDEFYEALGQYKGENEVRLRGP